MDTKHGSLETSVTQPFTEDIILTPFKKVKFLVKEGYCVELEIQLLKIVLCIGNIQNSSMCPMFVTAGTIGSYNKLWWFNKSLMW
jgi:hypothetical protein